MHLIASGINFFMLIGCEVALPSLYPILIVCGRPIDGFAQLRPTATGYRCQVRGLKPSPSQSPKQDLCALGCTCHFGMPKRPFGAVLCIKLHLYANIIATCTSNLEKRLKTYIILNSTRTLKLIACLALLENH